ncbi:MAG: tetratricopeptide repeat protein [Rikenellaceae bacterium]|nr:tetratricopeptide repeat protein [Rikenellaceae bacterium]
MMDFRKLHKPFAILLLLFALLAGKAEAQLNKYYFYWAGQNYMRDSKYRDAIETLNILLHADPDAYEAYFLRGVAKYNLDDLHGANHDFTLAITKNPVYTMAYHYRAITRSRLGDYDDALRDFQEAIELRPDMPGSYYSRGVTYLLSQQFEEAIEDFNEFLKFEPKVADAHINKGTAYLYLKDTIQALNCYNTAIETYSIGPDGYIRRGALYMSQEKFDDALADFDKAIELDSLTPIPYFNRAIVFANTRRPVEAIRDFDKVIELDSMLSIALFTRALLRSQIGDYNNALTDYDRVAVLNPNNVLVFYNRAHLNAQLGFYHEAVRDYSQAIELYPDFANAYLSRSSLRYYLGDERGAEQDRTIADQKIAEYRSKLTDSTFSIYADTSRHFNQLLSFDPMYGRSDFANTGSPDQVDITLLPLFRFSLFLRSEEEQPSVSRYENRRVENFIRNTGITELLLTNRETNISNDSLFLYDETAVKHLAANPQDWRTNFQRGITQALIRQYTNSINSYSAAIELEPSNAYLYINRSTTRAEMIDFISSINNSYQKITIDSDPVNRLKNTGTRTYNYDEAIHDLNAAAKLQPEFAHIYYNRANLHCLSGNMPEAYDDYTRAIELFPNFAEAYYNRGLVQIYLKDTRKGCLDISKAGELGIEEAYEVLRRYGGSN